MLKVMTIVGTRPEIIKLSRVIPELDRHFDHVLVHTGQNSDYELGRIFFDEMKLPLPGARIIPPNPGSTSTGAIGHMMYDIDCQLVQYQPDAVLILGDTNSGVAAAYAAKRRHIPLFHMEAGNRCFDERVPEETNRKIIDHISDINMPYTEHARRNLLAEGLPTDRVIKSGSPMREVLEYYAASIANSTILQDLELFEGDYLVVSAHREENVDNPQRLYALVTAVNLLSKDVPVVFSVHPRTRKRLNDSRLLFFTNVLVHEPFGFFDYIKLQQNAKCVISDSGTLTEEAGILEFPAVMIRQAHERPEGMDDGIVIMADLIPERVLAAVKLAVDGECPAAPDAYGDDFVSQMVVRTIASYTGYVQRTVYRKS